jgi:hypothetical protein
VDERAEAGAPQRVGREAEHGAHGRAGVADRAVRVDGEHGVGGVLQQQFGAALGRAAVGVLAVPVVRDGGGDRGGRGEGRAEHHHGRGVALRPVEDEDRESDQRHRAQREHRHRRIQRRGQHEHQHDGGDVDGHTQVVVGREEVDQRQLGHPPEEQEFTRVPGAYDARPRQRQRDGLRRHGGTERDQPPAQVFGPVQDDLKHREQRDPDGDTDAEADLAYPVLSLVLVVNRCQPHGSQIGLPVADLTADRGFFGC